MSEAAACIITLFYHNMASRLKPGQDCWSQMSVLCNFIILSLACHVPDSDFVPTGYMVSMEKQIQDQQVKFWMQWIGSCNVMGFDDGRRGETIVYQETVAV